MPHDVQLIYFNAGGGHRSAALALQEVIAQTHPDWAVTLVNLFEVIDSDRYYMGKSKTFDVTLQALQPIKPKP